MHTGIQDDAEMRQNKKVAASDFDLTHLCVKTLITFKGGLDTNLRHQRIRDRNLEIYEGNDTNLCHQRIRDCNLQTQIVVASLIPHGDCYSSWWRYLICLLVPGQRAPINSANKCKAFCHGSSFFSWNNRSKECFCKYWLAWKRSRLGGHFVSGKTDCIVGESGWVLDHEQCTELSPFLRGQQCCLGTKERLKKCSLGSEDLGIWRLQQQSCYIERWW